MFPLVGIAHDSIRQGEGKSSLRGAQPAQESVRPEVGMEPASRRMMTSLSKMLDNPTMNKVMVASQRGALQALYGDLIESFEFTGEEGDYFMDLLMSRQMRQVDFGKKLNHELGELGELGKGLEKREAIGSVAFQAAANEVQLAARGGIQAPEGFAPFTHKSCRTNGIRSKRRGVGSQSRQGRQAPARQSSDRLTMAATIAVND